MSRIKRIPIGKLKIGMYITEQTQGVADSTLNMRGLIKYQKTIDKLIKKSIIDIYIDTEKGNDSEYSVPINTNVLPHKPIESLEQERPRASAIYREALGLVSSLMQDVKLGKAVNVTFMDELADSIKGSVFRNQNALLCLSQIREKDRYLLEHSINVGILMGIFSRHLGYSDELVQQLITGALLHDIGKILVPDEILNKPGKLTPFEWSEMKRHVVYGQKVLLQSEGISHIARAVCGQHHERLDGLGYPLGRRGQDITTYGRLAAIVDVYDAITATRIYHEGMSPFTAMKRLVEWSDKHVDKTLVYHFIRCMNIYPVGTLVKLSNGKLGVVIETNTEKPDSPKIRVFYNIRHNHHESVNVLNLAKTNNEVKIVGTQDPKDHGLVLSDFL